jgi:hypothetical protein
VGTEKIGPTFMSTAQLQLNELNYRTLTYPPPPWTCALKKLPLVSMGGKCAQTCERGPSSVLAEFKFKR